MKNIFFLLFFSISYSAIAQDYWHAMSSPVLGIRNLATIGDTVIVSDKSNVYLSYNLGEKWENISAPEWGNESLISDIAVVNKRIFVAIYTFGNFVTDDFGKTWARYESGLGRSLTNLYPFKNQLLIASDKRVFLGDATTRDSDFKKVGKCSDDVKLVAGNNTKVCAITYDHKAFLMILNNNKWEQKEVSDGLPAVNPNMKNLKPWTLVQNDNGDFIVLFQDDNVYRLNQALSKWEVCSEKTEEIQPKSITALCSKNTTLWYNTRNGGIHKTTDFGKNYATWLNNGHLIYGSKLEIGTNHIFSVHVHGLAIGPINK